MVRKKISRLGMAGVLILASMAAGCASEAVKDAGASAKSVRYKVVTYARQEVKWSGTVPENAAFKEGSNITKVEMIFAQEIQGSDAEGNTAAKITIESLKYSSEVKGTVIVDFDSTRAQDSQSPMAGLIGKSYTIAVAPTGAAKVMDAGEIRGTVASTTATDKAAARLLSDESIEERHSGLILPEICKGVTKAGDTWKNTRTFEFGVLGSKTYERIYEVKEIKRSAGGATAEVEMSAIPTTEKAEEIHKQQDKANISDMFDSTGAYSGRLELDLNNCHANNYSETLSAEWVVAQPLRGGENNSEVVALVMSAGRSYNIEKIK